jgi:deoxyhypusine synthase
MGVSQTLLSKTNRIGDTTIPSEHYSVFDTLNMNAYININNLMKVSNINVNSNTIY